MESANLTACVMKFRRIIECGNMKEGRLKNGFQTTFKF